MRLALIPPGGFPVRVGDALGALRVGGDPERAFAEALEAWLVAGRVVLFSSGRAALAALLRAMRASAPPGRDVLLVPAFGCPSLLAAAAAVGLRVRCLDVDPTTLRLDERDLAREEGRNALALVAVHLLGLPERAAALAAWARERGVRLVDDAAQALGGSAAGRALGTHGDAGLLSFGRGKPLPLMGGGAAVVPAEIADCVAGAADDLPGGRGGAAVAVAAAGYALFRSPALFRMIERVPALEIGVTRYDPRIDAARFGAARARLGLRLLPRAEAARAARAARWGALAARLAEAGMAPPPIGAATEPAYLRYPLLAPDETARDALLRSLRSAGIGAARFYPEPLPVLAERHGLAAEGSVRGTPGARALAERLVTLPVHDGVSEAALERIARCVVAALGGVTAATRSIGTQSAAARPSPPAPREAGERG
jgi:dTDP-4-amino-4,6-dideoxygalactose transaminase